METQPTSRKQRYPRYKRADEPLAPHLDHPGANYRPILEALYDFRYLTTEHLKAHLNSPNKGVYQPLNRLYHGGLVERRYLFDRPTGIGSPQTIHTLSVEGARALFADEYRAAVGSLVRKRLERSWTTLAHHLAISEFQLLLNLGSRQVGGILIDRFASDKEDLRTRLRLRIPERPPRPAVRVTRWPDAFFVLVTPHGAYHYLAEIDRDDEDRPRKRSRVEERFFVYAKAIYEGRDVLARQLGIPGNASVQVLFVAPTAARRDQLIEIAAAMRSPGHPSRIGSPNFWFLAAEDYAREGLAESGLALVRDPVLRGLNGKPAGLLPPA